MKLGSIHIFPVKSGAGVDVDRARVEREGLAGDRRWMLVDAHGAFLSQREMPRLARLDVTLQSDGLILAYEEAGERFVPTPSGENRIEATVWRDTVDAALADEATNAALSRWLGQPVRLAYMDDPASRFANAEFAGADSPVSFADGFPILVATQASLRALNASIVATGAEAVPMSRFRPNLVVDDAEPWAEDGWATIRIGDAVLDLVKPCARCVMTTIDQATGVRAGDEPLRSLAHVRRSADPRAPGVLFGWNAVPRGGADIVIGAEVVVEEMRSGPDVVRPATTPRSSARKT